MKSLIVATLLVAFATPALAAEFYVVKDPKKTCNVTRKKPKDMTMLLDNKTYATKAEARTAMKSLAACAKK